MGKFRYDHFPPTSTSVSLVPTNKNKLKDKNNGQTKSKYNWNKYEWNARTSGVLCSGYI